MELILELAEETFMYSIPQMWWNTWWLGKQRQD